MGQVVDMRLLVLEYCPECQDEVDAVLWEADQNLTYFECRKCGHKWHRFTDEAWEDFNRNWYGK